MGSSTGKRPKPRSLKLELREEGTHEGPRKVDCSGLVCRVTTRGQDKRLREGR